MVTHFSTDDRFYSNFAELVSTPPLWPAREYLSDFYVTQFPTTNPEITDALMKKYNESLNDDLYIAISDLNVQMGIVFAQRRVDYDLDKMSLQGYLNIREISQLFINKFDKYNFISYDDTFIRRRSAELLSSLSAFLKAIPTCRNVPCVGMSIAMCAHYRYYADTLIRYVLSGAVPPGSNASKFVIQVESVLQEQFNRWMPETMTLGSDYSRMPPEHIIGLMTYGLDYIIENKLQSITHVTREPSFFQGFELFLVDMFLDTNLTQSLMLETAVGMYKCAVRAVEFVSNDRCIASAIAPVDELRGKITRNDRATVASNLSLLQRFGVISSREYVSLLDTYGTWKGGDKFYE